MNPVVHLAAHGLWLDHAISLAARAAYIVMAHMKPGPAGRGEWVQCVMGTPKHAGFCLNVTVTAHKIVATWSK